MIRIESLLSARLFVSPQWVGDKIYFLSNLSGHISLYVMSEKGSVPEPLLPPQIALQNPELIGGQSYYVLPKLGKILVMIDHDGDENYVPQFIPIEGGYPEPAFGEQLNNLRSHLGDCDAERNMAYIFSESRTDASQYTYLANLETGELKLIAQSTWGMFPSGHTDDHSTIALVEGYTVGDTTLFVWKDGERKTLYGTPLEERTEGQEVKLASFGSSHFTARGLLTFTALFEDTYGLGYLQLDKPQHIVPVAVTGTVHQGSGEFEDIQHVKDNRYRLQYNIDGCTWLYEGSFNEDNLILALDTVLVGEGPMSNGDLKATYYDKKNNRYVFSFCTATSPTQIYTVSGGQVNRVTNERVLGIAENWLSSGEDASYTSYDGLRISARLYMPAAELGFTGPRPVIFYIHGGPQGQERPNFAWFSMPLIQFLTLNGFAVYVPNARGSTGYGLSYTKYVDHDWGGRDRLDHVEAFKHLSNNPRLDLKRAGVVGRSYGGYMTLTLAARHPELWSAAVDMFGPYNLLTFIDRLPETWKPYFAIAIGDTVKDRDFLIERSPSTYIDNITAPMLVIQGKNDPRVTERESRDVVERLKGQGKHVDYLMFEDEGHDVLKLPNRVTCYNRITEFFKGCLQP
ncbi:MAG: prolyl oligopeptidase family serine peptidase [Anaerolineae bacterium]